MLKSSSLITVSGLFFCLRFCIARYKGLQSMFKFT